MAKTRVTLTDFVLNRETVVAIAVGPKCQAMVRTEVEKARAVAVSLSPRTDEADKEHYADQFKTDVHILTGFPRRNPTTGAEPMNRAAGVLYNTSDWALSVEWGWIIFDREGNAVGYRDGHDVLKNTLIEMDAAHRATP